jgi:hypothetical protein
VIRSQAAEGIAAREISSQLKREITIFPSEHGVLEASANIAYSMAIRQISRPRKRRELDESYRGLYEHGNAPVWRVLQVQLKFLEIDTFRNTEAGAGRIRVRGRRPITIAATLGVEKLGAIRML